MNESIARTNILNRINKALSNSTPKPYPSAQETNSFFKPELDSLATLFETKFTGLLGNFFLFDNIDALKEKLHQTIKEKGWTGVSINDERIKGLLGDGFSSIVFNSDLDNIDVAITDCAILVARTGTIVLRSDQSSGRSLPVYAPVHIVIAFSNQLVFDLKESLEHIMRGGPGDLPSSLVFASGPSRTGDIEKTLIVGVHGPREVFVFLLK
jgi:L-lactate dehydrogenase complex protein LldG